MNAFWQQIFWGNTILDYAIALGIILFVLLLGKTLSQYIARLTCRLLQRNWRSFNQKSFTELIVQPLYVFLTVTAIVVALYRLRFPAEINFDIYKYTFRGVLHALGTVVQLLMLCWLLLRIIDFIAMVLESRAALTPDTTDNQLILFFKDFFKVVICLVGGLLILKFAFHYNISSLVTGLSIVGAAIALSLRESLENLIASFVIFFDKPFRIGDLVKVQAFTGQVERIGLRSTRLRTEQKTYVTVPNKQMVDSILDNLSQRSKRRADYNLHLSLQTQSHLLESLIAELRGYLGGIAELSDYTLLLSDITATALVLHIEAYTEPIDIDAFQELKQNIGLHALRTMEGKGIKLAGAVAPATMTPDVRLAN